MIKEYINKLSDENNQNLNKLEKQMKDLLEELSCAEEWSETLQIKSNSQTNIFSPRNIDDEIGLKIEKAADSIQKKKQQIEYVRDLMETHIKKKNEYEKMLEEIENFQEESISSVDNFENSGTENQLLQENIMKFLSDIFSKTELCLALLNSDKNKCKRELNEIKYKIKKFAEEIENK